MRRVLIAFAGLVLAAVAVALWVSRPPPADAPALVEARPVTPALEFKPVEVRASNDQGLTLGGTVRGPDGAPIAGATVMLASTEQQSLTSVHCSHCNELLLSCRSQETATTVGQLVDAHQGELRAAATTTTDAEGRFRFERLVGISFTVWGKAAGHGLGVKERAAPGDPVQLFLPAQRSLSGRLRDEAGQPITGTVRAISRRLAEFVSTQADAEGRFSFDSLGEGPFYVHAAAEGFLPGFRAEVQAGPEPVVLTLAKPRTLEVRLVTSDKKPIAGVVRLTGDHVTKELPAKDGLAITTSLSPGTLMASAVAGELSAAPQAVTLTTATTQITLVLEKGGRLAITVLDEQEQPVPEPSVELLTTNGEPITKRRLQTGELAVLGPVATGDYLVRAQADGFTQATAPARVTAGESKLDVTLTRGTLIAGKVIDEYGRVAPGVSVLISPLGESAISGPDGRFRATVPSPGLYTLQAHHSDWGGGELKVSAPREDVELQLEPRAGCEITVMHGGRRIEGASVVMFTSDGNFRSDRVSGADGVVLMRGMPPNAYTVVATHPDFLPSERLSVKVDDGQLLRVNAELKPGANVTGQVVDTLGTPVAGVSVAVQPRGTEPAVTDGAGNFSLGPLRPNAVYGVRVSQRGFDQVGRVSATAGGPPVKVTVERQLLFRGRVLGAGAPLKRFRVDGHEISSSDGTFELPLPSSDDRVILTIESAGFEPLITDRPRTPDLGDFDLRRTAQVTGVVRDDSGGPVADAVVSCDTCEQSVMTNPEGRFSLSKPPYQHEFHLVAKKGRRTATRVVVGDAVQGLELVLRKGVMVSGTVWLAEGIPAPGVELSGVHSDRSEPVSVVTDAEGHYSLEVAPGSYRFVVASPQARSVSTDPPATIIDVSGPTRLDFGPAPGTGKVTVRVRPEPGTALWLVRGELRGVGNPPMELVRSSWAQLVYQPLTERVTLTGVPPGRYTLVWASFHASTEGGPVLLPIDVPAQGEVSLVR
ncbi:MAG: carboxypeptidase regulatory-like domain-containing protein [Myxococcaceae bacterium]|nr:carboxypeptidase regulatory-like domain-containing protein [Myxococcaceae bacterium]